MIKVMFNYLMGNELEYLKKQNNHRVDILCTGKKIVSQNTKIK